MTAPTGFESLPTWVQVSISAGMFVGTTTVAWFGYTKKKLGQKLEEQKSQDTVVISASFADSKVIDRLSASIEANTGATERLIDCVEDLRGATGSQTNSINYATDAIRQHTLELIRGK